MNSSHSQRTTKEIVKNAWKAGIVVPAFNIPYLPMIPPVIDALRDTGSFGLIQVARPEWMKFESKSVEAVRDEYLLFEDRRYTRLHLDHVPVVDEDQLRVDFMAIISEAIELGYESVMVDGSRLRLEENISETQKATTVAHKANLPIEGELGAVLGHEDGPIPPYEELFRSGRGFTDPAQARRYIEETGVDWLSVAIGNIHGAISGIAKTREKIHARLNIEHLDEIREVAAVPLVLHGGSGIEKEFLLEAFRHGIAKINIGTAIRQPYEQAMSDSIEKAREHVYRKTVEILEHEIEVSGSAEKVNPLSRRESGVGEA